MPLGPAAQRHVEHEHRTQNKDDEVEHSGFPRSLFFGPPEPALTRDVYKRQLLTKVAKEKGYTNLVHFLDDGISGVTMNRPGFVEMMQQLEHCLLYTSRCV